MTNDFHFYLRNENYHTVKSRDLSVKFELIEDNEFKTEFEPSYLYSNLESHGAPIKLSSDVALCSFELRVAHSRLFG